MNTKLLYRITTGVLLIFAALHTWGFLSFRPPSPEGLAVYNSMKSVHFQVSGATFTYGGFYEAFGLFATVYMLFSACVAEHLSRRPAKDLAWTFTLAQAAGLAISCVYFSTPQISFTAVLTLLAVLAAIRTSALRES